MNNQGGCNEERENYRVRGCVRVRRPHGVCIRGIRRAGAQLRSTAEYVACNRQPVDIDLAGRALHEIPVAKGSSRRSRG